MKKTLIIYLLFVVGVLNAQNLVINPSFEMIRKPPTDIGQLGYAYNWNSPTYGTPDLFSMMSKKKNSRIPINPFGIQDTCNGKNYIGIYTYSEKGRELIEFIQGELDKEMIKGATYKIVFDYSLAEISSHVSITLGVHLSSKKYYPNDEFTKKVHYSAFTSNKEKLSNQSNWNRFSEIYRATGKEKYIIIGQIEHEKPIKTNGDGGYAYYYIDNVSVTLVDSIKEPPVKKENVIIHQNIVINNIYFESGSSQLKMTSYLALDSLYKTLEQYNNSKYEIEISGHTDNVGNEEDNLKLSSSRAQTVANYLVEKGIKQEIIKHVGYGSSKPVADNETDEGREQNRRVEFIINKR